MKLRQFVAGVVAFGALSAGAGALAGSAGAAPNAIPTRHAHCHTVTCLAHKAEGKAKGKAKHEAKRHARRAEHGR